MYRNRSLSSYNQHTEHQTHKIKTETPCVIVKVLSVQNKESLLKAEKEKSHDTYKGRPIRITTDFQV